MFVTINLVRADKVLDANILARTIYREARKDGAQGMQAVACVIEQRSDERHMSLSAVCLQRAKKKGVWVCQFTCWCKATAQDKQFKALPNDPEAVYAQALAESMVAGKRLDHSVVKFANHYCALDCFPDWAEGQIPVAIIGGHKFFKL